MNGAPMFNGQKGLKYELWSCKNEGIFKGQGYDIWKLVMIG
jgi:hypothetical protein